jgi:hypothetical protein
VAALGKAGHDHKFEADGTIEFLDRCRTTEFPIHTAILPTMCLSLWFFGQIGKDSATQCLTTDGLFVRCLLSKLRLA